MSRLADPLATPAAQALYDLLQDFPKRTSKRLFCGQFLGFLDASGPAGWMQTQIDGITAKANGRTPSLVGASYGLNHRYPGHPALNDFSLMSPTLIAQGKAGGAVQIYGMCDNPALAAPDEPSGANTFSSNIPDSLFIDLYTSGTAMNARLNAALDNWAVGLEQLQAAGVVVLFVPWAEIPSTFWWSGAGSPDSFVKFYRYTMTYLTKTKGIHNCLWCLEWRARGDGDDYLAYYPGDDFVDIVGLSKYYGIMGRAWPGYAEAQAAAIPKPFAILECGPSPGNGPTEPYDMDQYIAEIKAFMPKVVSIMFWDNENGLYEPQHFGVNRIFADPWVLNAADLPLTALATPPPAPPPVPVPAPAPAPAPIPLPAPEDAIALLNKAVWTDDDVKLAMRLILKYQFLR